MLIRKAPDIRSSEITPKSLYLRRREFIQAASGAAVAAAAALAPPDASAQRGRKLNNLVKSRFSTNERQNSYEEITGYNNFYEFGSNKEDPRIFARSFMTRPWTIRVEGLVKKSALHDIDSLLRGNPLEERIYRLRCVEAWSMVVPWVGVPLAEVIKRLEPLPQ